jgi:hypothetical protein
MLPVHSTSVAAAAVARISVALVEPLALQAGPQVQGRALAQQQQQT